VKSVTLDALNLMPEIGWYDGLARMWQPGEHAAHARLADFCDTALADYADGREVPSVAGTSRLSPHLHFGEISPRSVWHRVGQHSLLQRSQPGAEAFLREIGWREFAHHVLFHYPNTPDQPLNGKYADFPWRENHGDLLSAWQRGRTGFPIVDAGMRELWHTGWMHNRVRMIVASLLVKNLRVPWTAGAEWFWDTLVDADLANNTLGWQWAAGSSTRCGKERSSTPTAAMSAAGYPSSQICPTAGFTNRGRRPTGSGPTRTSIPPRWSILRPAARPRWKRWQD
jgi:deoxyribodipyrimidine photo-lyase